jgi:AcrR family transcriptional regulator
VRVSPVTVCARPTWRNWRAAGISKGAFYLFYDSKQGLFIEVMAQIELEMQSNMLEVVRNIDEPSKSSFKQFLHAAIAILETHPLFANTSDEDYQLLLGRFVIPA